MSTTETAKPMFPRLDDSMERSLDKSGVKLEMVNGIPVWEAFPVYRHQQKTLEVQLSILNGAKDSGDCACISVADLTIRFPDGSIKRPDISIFCRKPPEEDSVCTLVPEAVIEILSKGYERKDTEISLPFYLSFKIPDIVIFDPETGRVSHYHDDRLDEYESPVDIVFRCGCQATI